MCYFSATGIKKPPGKNAAAGGGKRPAGDGAKVEDKRTPGVGTASKADSDEDPDLFGVLVTHEKATQLKLPGSLRVNVSMSVLLEVVANRMPWMLVLRRGGSVRLSVHRATTPETDDEQRLDHGDGRRGTAGEHTSDDATSILDPEPDDREDGSRGATKAEGGILTDMVTTENRYYFFNLPQLRST